jgi:hypothetical protein
LGLDGGGAKYDRRDDETDDDCGVTRAQHW